MRRIRVTWREVLTAVVTTFLMLGLSEVVLRYVEWSHEQDWWEQLFKNNAEGACRLLLTPNLKLSGEVEGQPVEIRINSTGHHWHETKYEKQSGSRRIAVIGDSFAFGMWSKSFETSFVGVFDSLVADRGFEVINFGVPAYSLTDALLQLEDEVVDYEPDHVLLSLYLGNDIVWTYLTAPSSEGNECGWKADSIQFRERVPPEFLPNRFRAPAEQAVPAEKAQDVPPATFARRILRRHSALYRRLAQINDRPVGLFTDSIKVHHEFFQETFWSRARPPEVAVAAVDTALVQLGRMQSLLETRGIHFGIITIPYRAQVYARKPVGVTYDVALPQLRIKQFAQAENIPYLDLTYQLREIVHGTNEELHFRQDVHLNDRGHRLVGRLIHDWFVSEVI